MRPHVAGQESAPQRGVRDEPDAQLPEYGEDGVLDLALEDRVLRLQHRHRLYCVGPADGVRTGFAESEVPNFARGDQFADHAGDLLDRHGRVDAVLVEDVEVVGAEVAQAVVGDFADALGTAVECLALPLVLRHVEAELGREHDVVAEALHRLAEQLLVRSGPAAVELGGVEEGDAELVSPLDGGDTTLGIGVAVRHRHAHRSESDRRHLEALAAEFADVHQLLLLEKQTSWFISRP